MIGLHRLSPAVALFFVVAAHGCRTPAPQTMSDPYGIVTADAPENFFKPDEFYPPRTYKSSADCSHDLSGINVLRTDGPVTVFNSLKYLYANSHPGQERLSYSLQWFTKDSLRSNGGTPIIRVVRKEEYPRYLEVDGKNSNCDFSSVERTPNRTAVMFVYGVGAPNRGEFLEWLDFNMLNAVINFEVTPNTPPPAGDNKIGKLPAYIQMVANQNAPLDGPFGKHDPDAATRVAFNLSMAYEGGIEELDILTHSNGMISSQIGYSYYARHFMHNDEVRHLACMQRALSQRVELNPDRPCHEQVKPLRMKFYHMQAAPDELWTINQKAPFPPGFYTDFVPVFEQVSKGRISAAFSYPTEDLSSYFLNLSHMFTWEFRYYYNNADFLTYPPTAGVGTFLLSPALWATAKNGYSSVGINESINWVEYAQKIEKRLGKERFFIGHYYCLEDSMSRRSCGQKHSAYHSIMDASHPSRIKLQHWKVWYK